MDKRQQVLDAISAISSSEYRAQDEAEQTAADLLRELALGASEADLPFLSEIVSSNTTSALLVEVALGGMVRIGGEAAVAAVESLHEELGYIDSGLNYRIETTLLQLAEDKYFPIFEGRQWGVVAGYIRSRDNERAIALIGRAARGVELRDESGMTVLMTCSEYGNHHVLEWLLKNGADPNARDPGWNTALSFSKESNDEKAEKILRKYGAEDA